MPHYRDVKGFALSLASVTTQTWTGDIRIVVVDDGSPPEDIRALEELLAEQPFPYTIDLNGENRGRPYTRNRLLDGIEAHFAAWLDAGDVWYPEKLARQFEHLSRLRFAGEDIGRVWVSCHYDWQREGQKRRLIRQEAKGDLIRELLIGDRLRAYLWTLLGTAETFRAAGRFDERLPRLQDLDYFLRFVRAGGVITVPPRREALCLYHKSDVGRSAREIRRCNQIILDKYCTGADRNLRATIRYNVETLSARYAKNNGDNITRSYYLGKAFMADPSRALRLVRRWFAQQVRA